MNFRTFGQLKAQIARVCGATGMPVTDPRVMEMVNLAVEEILNEGDFPWTVERLLFRVCDGLIVLPSRYDRVMNMMVDGIPQQINSPWYEMVAGQGWCNFPGPGWYDEWQWPNAGFTLDRDQVFQFRDIPRDQPYRLEVSTQLNEEVDGEFPTILIDGYDYDKNPIASDQDGTFADGEVFELGLSQAYSTSSYSQISGIIKPVTKGEVYVYAVGLNGARVHVGTYSAHETNPFYRSYRVVGGRNHRGCPSTVLARCRIRYAPVMADNDYVLCANIPALKKMVQAVWFGDAGNVEKYAAYKAIAVDILKKEAMAYRGKSRVPAITFQHGYGLGAMPFVR